MNFNKNIIERIEKLEEKTTPKKKTYKVFKLVYDENNYYQFLIPLFKESKEDEIKREKWQEENFEHFEEGFDIHNLPHDPDLETVEEREKRLGIDYCEYKY